MTPPLAHTGHVLVDLLMFAPVVVLLLWFTVVAVRDRRRDDDEPGPSERS